MFLLDGALQLEIHFFFIIPFVSFHFSLSRRTDVIFILVACVALATKTPVQTRWRRFRAKLSVDCNVPQRYIVDKPKTSDSQSTRGYLWRTPLWLQTNLLPLLHSSFFKKPFMDFSFHISCYFGSFFHSNTRLVNSSSNSAFHLLFRD